MHNIAIPFIVFLVAYTRHNITQSNMGWYKTIKKPFGSPTSLSLAIIWTTLFTLYAVSALIVWNLFENEATIAISMLFVANALLNIAWSYIYFVRHWMGIAVIEMCFLNATTLALLHIIWPLSLIASLLLVPYVLWITYATYIVFMMWRMNRFR